MDKENVATIGPRPSEDSLEIPAVPHEDGKDGPNGLACATDIDMGKEKCRHDNTRHKFAKTTHKKKQRTDPPRRVRRGPKTHRCR